MKITQIALISGFLVGGLGLLGLVSGDGRMAGEMNIDLMLDITRLGLGALLIFAGLSNSQDQARNALTIFGILYLGMFALGLFSNNLFGILPSRLGMIDQTIHLVGGLAGIYLGMQAPKKLHA